MGFSTPLLRMALFFWGSQKEWDPIHSVTQLASYQFNAVHILYTLSIKVSPLFCVYLFLAEYFPILKKGEPFYVPNILPHGVE